MRNSVGTYFSEEITKIVFCKDCKAKFTTKFVPGTTIFNEDIRGEIKKIIQEKYLPN
jgi:hypothetical protein